MIKVIFLRIRSFKEQILSFKRSSNLKRDIIEENLALDTVVPL